uniref:formin-like protein 16 isoform X1 n=1 Tax=Macaca mulatta TaxID=9544 RepID=UPI0010A24364|nr:formin-like protein 16 isoform X1 [Macaca mulatta]XP_028685315.1 formin-like protein 16 isoform X2 [Macaca mulatta]
MGTSSLRVASADALRGPCRGVNQTRVPLGGHRAEAIAAPPSARLLAQPRNLPRRARACDRKGRLLRRKPPRGGRFPALLLFGSEGNATHYWKGSAQHQSAGAGSAGGPSPFRCAPPPPPPPRATPTRRATRSASPPAPRSRVLPRPGHGARPSPPPTYLWLLPRRSRGRELPLPPPR